MIDYDQLALDVVGLVKLITGLPDGAVIVGNQGAPSPVGTCAAVKILGDQARGQANKSMRNSAPVNVPGLGTVVNFIDSTKAQKIVEIEIAFYRGQAVAYAGSLFEANKREVVSAYLWAKRLGWQRVGPVNNLTALEQANFEQRAEVKLYLYVEDTVVDTINKIYRVAYNVKSEAMGTLAEGEVNGLSS